MRVRWSRFHAPSLDERFSTRSNGMGLLRLVLAFGVLFSHAWTLGFGSPGLGWLGTATHARLNTLTVYGFFVISGFLITGSGIHSRPLGFARSRFLRIFPGFWACLAITALVLAPLAAWHERPGTGVMWTAPDGPLKYLWTNWFTSMNQYGISNLLTGTPYGHITGESVFDGSLWSLKYELACYVVVGILAAAGVLSRQPRVVVAIAAAFYLAILIGFAVTVTTSPTPIFPGAVGPIPLIGSFNVNQSVYLGFMFLLGAVIQLYRHRIPMHGLIALLAGAVVLLSMFLGGYVIVGLPAYAYALLYIAATIPKRLHNVGRKRDYSYGVYLYSFPVEQVLASLGAARWRFIPFLTLAVAGTLVLAILSWHLVEGPAMRLKHRSFRLPFRHRPQALAQTVPRATSHDATRTPR